MEITYFHKDIQKFFDSLDKNTALKTLRIVELLELKEYHLTMPYSKKIGLNLFELRILGAQNIRIFYSFYHEKIVLLHAIFKKSQRLMKRDIKVAQQRLNMLMLHI